MEMQHAPHFWLGALSATIRLAVTELENGTPVASVVKTMGRSLEEYDASPVARPREIVGLAILDALDECYAIRTTEIDALVAKGQAEDYLYGAETSGHPAASGWVKQRLPFRMVCVSAEERDELLEDGTPVLDREP